MQEEEEKKHLFRLFYIYSLWKIGFAMTNLALESFTKAHLHRFSSLFTKDTLAWDALKSLLNFPYQKGMHSSTNHVFFENSDQIFIGENTKVEPSVMIKGPCWIGNNCEIRHGAYIRPYTIILDGALIGHATEIARSIVFEGAKLSHFNYVGDSIIGKDANLGAGVRLANYRLDAKTIKVRIQKEKIDTGLSKFGSILGDNVSIGCNTVLNPGTLVFPEAKILPGQVIQGVFH